MFATILTGVIVAAEDFAAIEANRGTRAIDHLAETYDGWAGVGADGGVNIAAAIFHQDGFVQEEQAHCALK